MASRNNQKLTLTFTHMIYLTRDQRYDLFNLQDQEVVGTCISVWNKDNISTEPAKEIFCRYIIKNLNENRPKITIYDDGFVITLPKKIGKSRKRLSNEDWRNLTEEEKDRYYHTGGITIAPINLLDIKDGGSESLCYRETEYLEEGEQKLKITHFVEIQDINVLQSSLF